MAEASKKSKNLLTAVAQSVGSTLGSAVAGVTNLVHAKPAAAPAKKKAAKKSAAKKTAAKRAPAKKKSAAKKTPAQNPPA
jgi:hypothetical protein